MTIGRFDIISRIAKALDDGLIRTGTGRGIKIAAVSSHWAVGCLPLIAGQADRGDVLCQRGLDLDIFEHIETTPSRASGSPSLPPSYFRLPPLAVPCISELDPSPTAPDTSLRWYVVSDGRPWRDPNRPRDRTANRTPGRPRSLRRIASG